MLDFNDLLLLQMRNAARMTKAQYAQWQQLKRPEPIYEKLPKADANEITGEAKITNIQEIAKPLNPTQLEDTKVELRVQYEKSLQTYADSLMDRKDLAEMDTDTISTMQKQDMVGHAQASKIVETAVRSNLDRLQAKPDQYIKIPIDRTGQTPEGMVSTVINPTLSSSEYILEKKTPPMFDYPFHPIGIKEQIMVDEVAAERVQQMRSVETEVAFKFQDDIESGELHPNSEGQLVNKSLGDVTTAEARDSGKLGAGLKGGGIRGITGSGAFVPKGLELPRGAGGQGECCVFNYYGGGGCGDCTRGGSMSALRFARTVL